MVVALAAVSERDVAPGNRDHDSEIATMTYFDD